jgi:IS30 family transposase
MEIVMDKVNQKTASLVCRLYRDGVTVREIMAKCTVSDSTVMRIVRAAGLPCRRLPRHLSEAQKARAKQLREGGMAMANIAKELQVTKQSIRDLDLLPYHDTWKLRHGKRDAEICGGYKSCRS